jgi:D-serine deaminase-like pyridoxal phosphate-dependent protein
MVPFGVNIIRPTVVVDEAICRRNIGKMAEKARSAGVRFRPHFKTHQSATIGEWFREAGVTAITVSSVTMARYFADAGWKEITIAFPVNIRELEEINRLAREVRLELLVENEIVMRHLVTHLKAPVGIWIEIDTGYHRTGVDTVKTRIIDQMLEVLKRSDKMVFRGFLSHSGQTYSARSVEDIRIRHADVLLQMRSLKNHYQPEWPGVEVSLGDTPACTVCDQWEGVDEIRPGNFVFYDLMQWLLGVCSVEDIAVRVVCPVVSKQIMRNEVVIYGGAVHLSKELMIGPNGKKWYGGIVLPERKPSPALNTGKGYVPSDEHGQAKFEGEVERSKEGGSKDLKGSAWEIAENVNAGDIDLSWSSSDKRSLDGRWRISGETWVAGLSQEHGIIRGAFEDIKAMQPGDLLEIIPVHSCLAADLAGYYLTTMGQVVSKMGRGEEILNLKS